jgi:hypothetical protein
LGLQLKNDFEFSAAQRSTKQLVSVTIALVPADFKV